MKAQFNKSEIFKAAWSFVKTAGKSLSEALKAAWAKAKKTAMTFTELVSLTKENDTSKFTNIPACEEYKAIVDTCESMFPALQGSDKQVKWAEGLRSKLVKDAAWVVINSALLSALDALKKNVRRPYDLIIFGETSYQKAIEACKTLAVQPYASFYINHRDEETYAYQFISKLVTA